MSSLLNSQTFIPRETGSKSRKTKMKKKTKKSKTADRNLVKPTHEAISLLAHQLFERDGKKHGNTLEHWFNAESMLESNFGYGRDHFEHDFSKTNGME